MEDIVGKTFFKATCTRWCSEYYAVERVVEVGLEKVVECQQALGQTVMTQADMRFLTSFVKVMKPLVTAMRLTEGETESFMGQMIPPIQGLEKKLGTLSDDSVLTKPLTSALLHGIRARFDHVSKTDEYRIAAMLHPKFKFGFIPQEEYMQCRQLLLLYIQRVQR